VGIPHPSNLFQAIQGPLKLETREGVRAMGWDRSWEKIWRRFDVQLGI
jgi:hypothetical protein